MRTIFSRAAKTFLPMNKDRRRHHAISPGCGSRPVSSSGSGSHHSPCSRPPSAPFTNPHSSQRFFARSRIDAEIAFQFFGYRARFSGRIGMSKPSRINEIRPASSEGLCQSAGSNGPITILIEKCAGLVFDPLFDPHRKAIMATWRIVILVFILADCP